MIEPLGGAMMNKKKVSQPAWVRRRINGRTVFDPFRLPPNGAKLNGLPASWTSCFLDFLPRHGSPRRVSILVTWFSSPCDCFNTWLVNPFFPLSLSFFPFRSILFFLSSDERRENFRFDACVEFSRYVELFCTCEFLPRVSYFSWYTFSSIEL